MHRVYKHEAPQGAATRELADIAIFAALVAIGAKISFSFPYTPVPVTAQTLFVLIAGLVLGPRGAFLALLAYLGLGAVGLPVFSKGGGIGYLLGPTGGFLLAFPFAAAMAGYLSERLGRSVLADAVSVLVALAITYALGAAQLALVLGKGFAAALALAVFPFVPADVFKGVLAVAAARILSRRGS